MNVERTLSPIVLHIHWPLVAVQHHVYFLFESLCHCDVSAESEVANLKSWSGSVETGSGVAVETLSFRLRLSFR